MLIAGKTLLMSFLILLYTNCSSSSGYLKDRGNDFSDIFDISIGAGAAIGGVAYIGEKNLGAIALLDASPGLYRGNFQIKFNWLMGVGLGFKNTDTETFYNFSRDKKRFFRKKKLDENNSILSGNSGRTISPTTNNIKSINSRIGFKVAYIVTFEFAIYTGEIADFFLGWFGADIYNDDYHKNIDKMKEEL